jgi:isoleucyl-tRNA synthetase
LQFEDKAFRVLVDTYVTDADGTGIVHQAPAFGEDDHRISVAHDVLRQDEMPPCPIDDKGHFTAPVSDFVGLHVKVEKHPDDVIRGVDNSILRQRMHLSKRCSKRRVD